MDDVERLLSEDFIEFSKKIADLYAIKREKKQAFKIVYEQYQKEIADLEEQAHQLKVEFESKAKNE